MPRRCIAKLWNPSSQDTASTEVSVGPETDLTNLQTKKCLWVVVKNKVTTSEQRLLLRVCTGIAHQCTVGIKMLISLQLSVAENLNLSDCCYCSSAFPVYPW